MNLYYVNDIILSALFFSQLHKGMHYDNVILLLKNLVYISLNIIIICNLKKETKK